jgi:hypothetical protein
VHTWFGEGGDPVRNIPLGDLYIDGRIILKYIFKE